ncbi:transposase [Sinorhizobium prairiense]|uniref:transposase n=1 Tax=unclassified Sinorhizobium TaxID=2613772 RepID=UPI0023D83759|nr:MULTISPECIES: transposase [unclassified Sinorhizobium]WEJ08678.1 transposase [Sinorhizobium sp. M103]WEJ13820.1 transposase [Sinorhizobium sp. K101]WEJ35420.1 transposase [Sinorhizobium sp. C101]
MADESNTGPVSAVAETNAEVKAPTGKKQKSPKSQKTAAEPVRAQSKAPAAKARRYGEQEKTEKLKLIETQVTAGKSTLKDAIKSAGISEQTYYQWKRTAKPAEQKPEKAVLAGDDELADFVRLEEENERLRKLLAEKLRAENADLRKRLGLD